MQTPIKLAAHNCHKPIHTVSHINDNTHDISLLSDTSIFDQTTSQISSPTSSQIAINPFNPPQGPVTNFERFLSQAPGITHLI